MSSGSYAPPPQRAIPARIFTTAGWIVGEFQVPALRVFSDFVNHPQDFFKLTRVRLPGLDHEIPFFAVQRRSIVFITPEGAPQPSPVERKRQVDVSCAFNGGVISGSMNLPQNIRVSDFLAQRHDFFPLTGCTIHLRVGGRPEVTSDVAMAIVNAARVVGVSEPAFL